MDINQVVGSAMGVRQGGGIGINADIIHESFIFSIFHNKISY
jgi:hypothetical protein